MTRLVREGRISGCRVLHAMAARRFTCLGRKRTRVRYILGQSILNTQLAILARYLCMSKLQLTRLPAPQALHTNHPNTRSMTPTGSVRQEFATGGSIGSKLQFQIHCARYYISILCWACSCSDCGTMHVNMSCHSQQSEYSRIASLFVGPSSH